MSKIKVDESMIHGEVEPGFEEVWEEFKRNFRDRGEIGAACAVYHEGKKVVDLWGGYRDHKKRLPWEEDTMVLVLSVSKGMCGMALAIAHSRGFFDYEEKVATYWPEFAQQGKEDVTVRQLLSHQAGLPVIDEPLTLEKLADLDAVAAAIAKQKPAWEPGTRQGYHVVSLGFYENELIRRVDPEHRSIGQFLQDELARPLGIEFYIGTPADMPEERIATLKDFGYVEGILHMREANMPFVLAMLNPRSLTKRSFFNPKFKKFRDLCGPAVRVLEIPAANGIGQARGVARAYSAFVMGGGELGVKEETLEALTAPPKPPSMGLFDEILRIESRASLGFMKPFPDFPFSTSVKAYGTPGVGGAFGFADPDTRVGYAYTPNRLGISMLKDPRESALRNALNGCLQR